VDLTNVDLTRPFIIDFSVGATAGVGAKQTALNRLRTAVAALQAELPLVLFTPDIRVPEGRFVVVATPLGSSQPSPEESTA
jgi:hypothetical protein